MFSTHSGLVRCRLLFRYVDELPFKTFIFKPMIPLLLDAGCCNRTRDANENNEDIKNAGERSRVMSEILNVVISYLEGVFGRDNPSNN